VLDAVPSDPEPLHSPLLHKIRLEECMQRDEHGCPHIDIELLHAALNDAHLARPQHEELLAPSQSVLRREIVALLKCAIAWNEVYAVHGAMQHLFEAWRQILESALNECYEQLRGETVVYEMIQLLLALLVAERTRTELATAASQSLVALVAKLRVSFLNYTVNLAHDASFNPENYLPVEQLHTILRGIVAALLRSESTPAMRGNLYTVLLNYLQFTHTPTLSLHAPVQHADKLVRPCPRARATDRRSGSPRSSSRSTSD
jgi:nuclear pore complex protein Nup205